ncbi:MAG TPA: class I SAM-dependent methyltransferase [Candidatus Saccharimonadales bacterium]
MNDDYMAKTIQAYDNAPDKFVTTTDVMINAVEMGIMLKYMPDKSLPILDVGSGKDSGVLTKMGYKTVGIDMSKQLLDRAKSLHPDLDFEYMDVRNLDLEDNSFGSVWCNAVLLHLNDQDLEKALIEIYRVLAPKGIVAVSFKEGEGSREVIETFSSESSRFYNFKSEQGLNRILENAGFIIKQNHTLNERERFGPDVRDLDWVWSFGTKG